MGNTSQTTRSHLPYGIAPATRHKWTCPALTPASKLVLDLPTLGMEGWVDLGYPTMRRPRVELAIFRSRVRRSNHYTTELLVEGCGIGTCCAVVCLDCRRSWVTMTPKPWATWFEDGSAWTTPSSMMCQLMLLTSLASCSSPTHGLTDISSLSAAIAIRNYNYTNKHKLDEGLEACIPSRYNLQVPVFTRTI